MQFHELNVRSSTSYFDVLTENILYFQQVLTFQWENDMLRLLCLVRNVI